jgi:hypothetical protein
MIRPAIRRVRILSYGVPPELAYLTIVFGAIGPGR